MKKLVVAAALATLLAAPAFAQSANEDAQMLARHDAQMRAANGTGAYAAVIGETGAVNQNGTVVHRDPDANVRLQLRRDNAADWND